MNKIDFICYLTAKNCNPNGDMEENNRPRMDLDTGLGIMTDVCIKRKIRDAIAEIKECSPGYALYINNDMTALETKITEILSDNEQLLSKDAVERDRLIKAELCRHFYDIRAFGGAITYLANKKYCDGQLTGAVQIGFAESLEPICPTKVTITRVAISTEADLKKKTREVGMKWIVPYGVYKFEGHISGSVAEKNGFNEEDIELLIEAITKMYDLGYSSSKTGMEVTKLIVCKHRSKLGDCSFRKIKEAVKEEFIENIPGRKEVKVSIDHSLLPESIIVEEY